MPKPLPPLSKSEQAQWFDILCWLVVGGPRQPRGGIVDGPPLKLRGEDGCAATPTPRPIQEGDNK